MRVGGCVACTSFSHATHAHQIYYFGAAIVAGSCISSGLFVPMLLMGACIGRFWGLVAVRIATTAGLTAEDFQKEEWAWIDPGVFAMVGAGAFMAGVSRLTLSLAVIVMEMTNEVHFLLPLLIAIMVAKWVADALEHALYHSLLEFKNVPFLPSEPFGGATLDMLSVRDIMCPGPVICVKEV
jgi:chloride channel 7